MAGKNILTIVTALALTWPVSWSAAEAATRTWAVRIEAIAPSTANDLHFRWSAASDGISHVPADIVQHTHAGSPFFTDYTDGEGRLDFINDPAHSFAANQRVTVTFNILTDANSSAPVLTAANWTLSVGGVTQDLGGSFILNGVDQFVGGSGLTGLTFVEGRWQDVFTDLGDPVPLPAGFWFFATGAGLMLAKKRSFVG